MDAEGVKAARKLLRIEAKDVARFSGISRAHMSSIETGQADVPVYVATIIALLEKFEPQGAVNFMMELMPPPPGTRPRGRPRKLEKTMAASGKKKRSLLVAATSPRLARDLDIPVENGE